MEQVPALLPGQALKLSEESLNLDDEAYVRVVGQVIADGTDHGEGASFVTKRRLQTRIDDYATANVLSFSCQLLLREKGTHWILVVHTGERALIGASPE